MKNIATPDVESFDVFDTVLTRRVGNPRSLFLLLGRRLWRKGMIECSPQAFAIARTNAEIRAFKNGGGLDSTVCLSDIHRDLAQAIQVPRGLVDKFVEEELGLERDLLVPVPDGVRRIQAARQAGKQVVFVSDMYVGAQFLRDQLVRHGLFEQGDRLYLSNVAGRSKANGTLWNIVVEDLGVSPSKIHHTGDDRKSDYSSARRANIAATLVAENKLNRYEEALERHAFETDGLSSALAGASRLSRISDQPLSKGSSQLRSVAAGVVAPFVIGKVLWLLEHAKTQDLEAIYFVARDGQVLQAVAEQLAPKIGYSGELKYLYGSRQAWVLPSMYRNPEAAIETLCPDDGDVDASLRTILRRLDIEPEEISQTLHNAGFSAETFDSVLPTNARAQLRRELRNSPELCSRVVARAAESRDLLHRYLEQEGVLADRSIGLVDLGTGATLFNALSKVFETAGVRPPTSFYFGLRKDVLDEGFGLPETYIRNEVDRLGYLRTPGLLTLVEMVCTAEHGSVTGYTTRGDRVEPVFTAEGNAPVADWGLSVAQEAIRNVAAELILDPDLVTHRQVDLRPAMLETFNLFWNTPTAAEAEVWGCYPFEDGWGDESVRHRIAERRPVSSALRAQPHRHWWHGGSQQLSGPVSRQLQRSRIGSVQAVRKVRNRLGQ